VRCRVELILEEIPVLGFHYLFFTLYCSLINFFLFFLSFTLQLFPYQPAVLGGIQINLSEPHRDRFMPLTFEVCGVDGSVEDCLHQLIPGAKSKSLFPLK